MRRFMLDTNILSSLVKNPSGGVRDRIQVVGEDSVCTSVVVAAELRFGAAKRGSDRLTAQVEAVLGALDVLPLEPPIDAIYGELRAELERAGTPITSIGGNDLLIAAHALEADCVLVTHNVGAFERVRGLTVEDWLA